MRRIALVLCLLGAAGAARADGVLTSVPRAQFVANVPLGEIERVTDAPVAPALKTIDGKADDWDRGVDLTHLGGMTTIQAGELIYEDWILDDSGAARRCVVARRDRNQPIEDLLGWSRYEALDSALGEELIPDVDAVGITEQPPFECEKGVERYGAAGYPPGATSGSADLVELRVAADATDVFFLVRMNAMTATDQPVVAIAVDSDGDLSTGAGDWGFGSAIATPGADHVVTLTRSSAFVDGSPAAGSAVASDDGGPAGPGNPGGFGGVIEARVPRSAIATTSVWRLWAGAGVWDPVAGNWRAPTAGEPGPKVLNLAFRGGREPLRPWMEESQAFALRRACDAASDGVSRLDDRFTATVDLDRLAAGQHETWRLRPGYYDRIFLSRVTDGGARGGPPPSNPESGPIGARQIYGLYVPTDYDSSRPTPLTLWLHWRGPGDHQVAYYDGNMVWSLAEARGNALVSPRGRGSSGWYVGDSQIDALDALADAEAFVGADREREYVAGYSMGGFGTYLLSMLYPDRFAAAFVTVGPPALGAWFYPFAPIMPQNGRPLYFTNPLVGNARHVPTVIFHGTDDELVPVTGTVAQADTYQLNHQPYEFFLFPGYEHFTFAIVDEWARAAAYLGDRRRATNPARVTYTRTPCLDPRAWSPVYDEHPDAAYWVSAIAVRDATPTADCIDESTGIAALAKSGTVDVISHALPRPPDVGGPIADVGGPPDHTTPWIMTGYEPRFTGGGPAPENAFEATVTNVKSFTIDRSRAGLRSDVPLRGVITSDGETTLTLSGPTGGTLRIDDRYPATFDGTVAVPSGTHTIEIGN